MNPGQGGKPCSEFVLEIIRECNSDQGLHVNEVSTGLRRAKIGIYSNLFQMLQGIMGCGEQFEAIECSYAKMNVERAANCCV